MTTLIRDKKTVSVRNHLFSNIMLKFSFPRILHLGQWCRNQIKTYGEPLTTTWHKETLISPHHLQANGKLESSHRFISDSVWKFSIDGSLNGINYSHMQQLHLIGLKINIQKNHTSCALDMTLTPLGSILMCYAVIKVTLIGLKQPLVTSHSQARRLDMLCQHAKCNQAIPACNCAITGQGS